MKNFILITLLFTLFSCSTTSSSMPDKIFVRDKNFEITKQIQNSQELSIFHDFWKERELKAQKAPINYDYRFDVYVKGKPSKWLYDSKTGLCSLLSGKNSEVYFIPKYVTLNAKLNLK
ncbi:MAG: hypothetical protein MK193_04105 [Lentisphaeria bacterium]|nr:hypothetical protein [Lentisphaeria bacterium]